MSGIEPVVVRNPMHRAVRRQINRLSDEDQQALVILLYSLINRSQMERLLAS